MTLLPSSTTIRGFTANNLRGSVRYWHCLLASALGSVLTHWVASVDGLDRGGLVSGPIAHSQHLDKWFGSRWVRGLV